jgi:hypothetical protein
MEADSLIQAIELPTGLQYAAKGRSTFPLIDFVDRVPRCRATSKQYARRVSLAHDTSG